MNLPVPMAAHRWLLTLRRPIFGNVSALYEQEGGAGSVETDFGVHWCLDESGAVAQHRFRVSHVRDTGVVYAVALSFAPVVVMLAKDVPLDSVEYALQGWADRSAPTLAWAAQRLAQWDPASVTEAPFFEDSVSPLHVTNDGRVERRTAGQEAGVYALAIDGAVTWRTRDRMIADAFIAGWDARDDEGGR